MGSLRLVLCTASRSLFEKQQQCVRSLVQSQRLFGNHTHPGITTTCMVLQSKKQSETVEQSRNYSFWCHLNGNKRILTNANVISGNLFIVDDLSQKRKRGISSNESKCAKKTDTAAASADAASASADAGYIEDTSKLGLFAKFKLMYKKYWYVLLPVHIVTSIGWFGGFYYMSKSGVDIVAVLEWLNVSETIISKLQHSNMGHYAIAYLCYKIATPLRYALTLGGTTIAIKVLAQAGHIKPIPTKTEFIAMYEKKKDSIQARFDKSSDAGKK